MSFRRGGKALLPFGLEYSDLAGGAGQAQEKPELVLPINGELNQDEENSAKQSIAFNQLIMEGPFYTGSSIGPKEATGDGIQRHSDKYKKTQKIGRTIEEHPYQLEFFPDELYLVMGISNKQKKKLLALSSYKEAGGLKQYAAAETDADKAQSLLEKLKDLAEDIEENGEKEEAAEDLEEDFDDEFEEDDDDDYNAEKYFDDGDDDGIDGGDDEAAF